MITQKPNVPRGIDRSLSVGDLGLLAIPTFIQYFYIHLLSISIRDYCEEGNLCKMSITEGLTTGWSELIGLTHIYQAINVCLYQKGGILTECGKFPLAEMGLCSTNICPVLYNSITWLICCAMSFTNNKGAAESLNLSWPSLIPL